jgi:hypothetical protein
MRVATVRFFGVEHALSMVIGLVALHVGRVISKRASGRARHKRVAIATGAALFAVFIGVPWPGLPYARPLARVPARSPDAPPGCPPVYAKRCATRHGARGAGDGPAATSLKPAPRDFTSAGWLGDKSDADLATTIREGGRARGLSAAMPSHSDLPPDEVKSLVTCVRRLACDKSPSSCTPD